MSLLERYPHMKRDFARPLQAILKKVPGLDPRESEDVALAINNIADRACDLDEIFGKLLAGDATTDDLADLLIAFELTVEQIRGDSDTIQGKLYELGDRLRRISGSAAG